MSDLRGLGMSRSPVLSDAHPKVSYVLNQRVLHRVLNFTGRTIDDVVNCPIAKNQVRGYFKLHRFVQRRCEVRDLERQWNPAR